MALSLVFIEPWCRVPGGRGGSTDDDYNLTTALNAEGAVRQGPGVRLKGN